MQIGIRNNNQVYKQNFNGRFCVQDKRLTDLSSFTFHKCVELGKELTHGGRGLDVFGMNPYEGQGTMCIRVNSDQDVSVFQKLKEIGLNFSYTCEDFSKSHQARIK